MSTEDEIQVKTAGTTFEIIDALKALDQPSVSEIAEYLSLPKSTAHDHLSTLVSLEFVVKEEDSYRLGARFLEYGGYTRENMKIYRVARPVIKQLASEIGEHANLMVEEHGLGIFLYKAKGENAVDLDTYPGMRVPLQTTAMGKAILAFMPRERVDQIIEQHGLPQVTENTFTSREELYEELEDIRDRGYAVDNQERVEGMRCVGAPITDHSDTILGAVSVSAPVSRMGDERFEDQIPREVLNAANVIEVNMSYS